MSTVGLHVVLGATGVVGRETTAALRERGCDVAGVSLSGRPSADAPSRAADLRDAGAVLRALEGADTAYLTVGLPYSLKAWRSDWPTIVRNTIDACMVHGTHLVYCDNVYAYGRVDTPMTEATPIHPASKRGQLPTAPALTGEQYMAMASGESLRHRTMTSTTLRIGALFNRAAREAVEMAYQNAAPYLFDSTLFESTFAVSPTPYADGIRTSLEHP